MPDLERGVCVRCHEPYVVTHAEDGPTQDYQDILCPSCGRVTDHKKTAGVFTTRKLTSDERARWRVPPRPS